MTWFLDHLPRVWELLVTHAWLAAVPLVVGLVIALPVGWVATRYAAFYGPLVAATGLLYTIPSLALFVLMPSILGIGILSPLNVVVALTLYTVALLVRTVADGLNAVPDSVVASATAMGIGPARRFFTIELPLAVPVIASGRRVAAVSNVSIVSVAALIGVAQLGSLFTDGFARAFIDPILVGIVVCMALAMVFDGVIVLASRWITPWTRQTRGSAA